MHLTLLIILVIIQYKYIEVSYAVGELGDFPVVFKMICRINTVLERFQYFILTLFNVIPYLH